VAATRADVIDTIEAFHLVPLVPDADLARVLCEDAGLPLGALEVPGAGRVVLVVGPEGGISPEELAVLGEAGAHVVRLGAEVLRTSTAGVVAVAAVVAPLPEITTVGAEVYPEPPLVTLKEAMVSAIGMVIPCPPVRRMW